MEIKNLTFGQAVGADARLNYLLNKVDGILGLGFP